MRAVPSNRSPLRGEIATTMILPYSVRIHVRKDVLNEHSIIDITKHTLIPRGGETSFGRLGDASRLPRLLWEQEQEKIKQDPDSEDRNVILKKANTYIEIEFGMPRC
ncbi:hypothetical protein EDC04DRAFT_460850 [Pisolithus marmoratus]|nr:hypothetical protein EDC04DRAFT_460850 [Pisolithus marmoratus]